MLITRILNDSFFLHVALIIALESDVIAADNQDKDTRLVCSYSHTVDEMGKSSHTFGEELFTVVPRGSGQCEIRKHGLGATFIGTMSEEEIAGKTNYVIDGIRIEESIVINRFTGRFQMLFRAVGKGELIHYGTCSPANKKMF